MFSNSLLVIGIIEVDLNQNISLIYIAPNYTLNLIRFTDYENTNNSQTDEEEETQPHRNSSAFMNKIIEDDENSDDENEDFLYRQNLFSGYEERELNPENT